MKNEIAAITASRTPTAVGVNSLKVSRSSLTLRRAAQVLLGPSLVLIGIGCSDTQLDAQETQPGVQRTQLALSYTGPSTLGDGDMFTAEIRDHRVARGTIQHGVASIGKVGLGMALNKEAIGTIAPRPKIARVLRSKAGPLEVIINLADNYQMPLLPRMGPRETRESNSWRAKSAFIENAIAKAKSRRAVSQDKLVASLRARGAKVHSKFWLINAVHATIAPSDLAGLDRNDEVTIVEPASGGGELYASIADGRAVLNSDPYFNTPGLSGGYIAVMDTGIRWPIPHTLLGGQTSWVRDCVNGWSNNCRTPGPGLILNPADVENHGNGVASVMSGNNTLGNENRGTTDINIDSFRVTVSKFNIPSAAVIRGYQAAVAGGSNVVNNSFRCDANSQVTCRLAVEAASEAGLVIVAAVGNSGTNDLYMPAAAKWVMTVGAVDALSETRVPYSSLGPTADSRPKPDLMAVSGLGDGNNRLFVADSVGPHNMTGKNGTSYAAPFVAGAAGFMDRWLQNVFNTFTVEPGQTMAMLYASGDNHVSPATNNSIGAGILRLPTAATLHGGKVSVTTGQAKDVTISVPSSVQRLDVAIWWREKHDVHNDVDLYLIRPGGGSTGGSSTSAGSVWEKVHADTTESGNWIVRTLGYSVTGSQDVFWAAIIR